MKRTVLLVCALILSATIISAQIVCPTSFSRNNGNGGGCSGKLIFSFATCPNQVLKIDSIYANGVKQLITIDAGTCNSGKSQYCFHGPNIPPSGGLQVYFSIAGVPTSSVGCYVPDAAGLLPVTLISFDAKKSSDAVMINWITTNEINHDRFEIERSFDNIKFKTIAVVLDGVLNASGEKKYAYKDASAELTNHAVIYYRLKQTDSDGKSTLSDIRVVTKTTISSMEISPNPFTANIIIKFTSEEKGIAEVKLVDVLGAKTKSKSMTAAKGINSLILNDLSKLKSGMYFAIVSVNGKVICRHQIIK